MKKTNAAIGLEMPVNGVYTCKSFSVLEAAKDNYCHLVVLQQGDSDTLITALLFTEEHSLLDYVDQKVRCLFRTELVEGVTCVVVTNLTLLAMVTTLTEEKGVKLYLKDLPESKSTIVFEQVTEEDPVGECIVFVASATLRRSGKSTFIEYEIIDRNHRKAKCRLFNPEDESAVWSGFYGQCNLSFSSQWGFRAEEMAPIRHLDVYEDPLVVLCKKYLHEVLETLPEKWETALTKINFIDSLYQNASDRNIFVVAIACHLAQDLPNVTGVLTLEMVLKGILARYLYCSEKNENPLLSKAMQSSLILIKSGIVTGGSLNALDQSADKLYLDNVVAKSLIDIAEQIVTVERDYHIDSKVIAWK